MDEADFWLFEGLLHVFWHLYHGLRWHGTRNCSSGHLKKSVVRKCRFSSQQGILWSREHTSDASSDYLYPVDRSEGGVKLFIKRYSATAPAMRVFCLNPTAIAQSPTFSQLANIGRESQELWRGRVNRDHEKFYLWP